MGIEEILAAILTSSALRSLVEEAVVSAVAEIMHRRTVDPDYLQKSDALFAARAAAKNGTSEDLAAAQKALMQLMAS